MDDYGYDLLDMFEDDYGLTVEFRSTYAGPSTAEQLEAAAARLLAQADDARVRESIRADLLELEPLAGDDGEVPVIRFDYRFANGSATYKYAAIGVDTTGYGVLKWSTTGPKAPKSFIWAQLVDWWLEGTLLELWVVTGYERLA